MRQYNLAFKAKQNYLEEDYINTSSNDSAYNIISNFPNTWGIVPYPRTLLLIGPKAAGKTHLAYIWAKKAGAEFYPKTYHHNQSEILHTPSSRAERLDPGLPRHYVPRNNKHNIIVDDIENYAEEELFHLFNYAHEEGKYLLMTTSSKPQFALPDLQSRLNSVNTLYLDLPDEQLVKILLMRGFSNRSIKVGIEVIDYLSTRIDRDFYSIETIIEELDKFSLSDKRKITIPLIKEFLKNIANTL